jgi:hypothetical protein
MGEVGQAARRRRDHCGEDFWRRRKRRHALPGIFAARAPRRKSQSCKHLTAKFTQFIPARPNGLTMRASRSPRAPSRGIVRVERDAASPRAWLAPRHSEGPGPRPTATMSRVRGARWTASGSVARSSQARPGISESFGSRENAAVERREASAQASMRAPRLARRGRMVAPLGAPSPRPLRRGGERGEAPPGAQSTGRAERWLAPSFRASEARPGIQYSETLRGTNADDRNDTDYGIVRQSLRPGGAQRRPGCGR